ncbi:hypothetical protein GCM10009674_03540 [Nesterenkonia xinjiangensis]
MPSSYPQAASSLWLVSHLLARVLLCESGQGRAGRTGIGRGAEPRYQDRRWETPDDSRHSTEGDESWML